MYPAVFSMLSSPETHYALRVPLTMVRDAIATALPPLIRTFNMFHQRHSPLLVHIGDEMMATARVAFESVSHDGCRGSCTEPLHEEYL